MLNRTTLTVAIMAGMLLVSMPAEGGKKRNNYNPPPDPPTAPEPPCPDSKCATFDFRAHNGSQTADYFEFTDNGITVKTSPSAFDYDGNLITTASNVGQYIGQYSRGLGVTNSWTNSGRDGSHTVDGSGWKDLVILEFDTTVVLQRLIFGSANSSENVEILDADLSTSLGIYSLNYYGEFDNHDYYYVDLPSLTGNKFAVKAPGDKDDWKLAAALVCTPCDPYVIPSPAAGLAGMGLLGMVMVTRRRLV